MHPAEQSSRIRIAHLTTVHQRNDIRIRIKEVATLAHSFGTVVLLVQDGKGDAAEDKGRVRIVDIGAPGGRMLRALRGSWRMWRTVRRLRPEIVHFHDPELIPLGFLFKLVGMKVVYDVHEDVPRHILSKDWLPRWLRWPIAKCMAAAEWLAGKAFDAIMTVTPTIALRFPARKTVLVQNFPLGAELAPDPNARVFKSGALAVYVGGLSVIRGAREMVEAMARLPDSCELRLALAGNFSPPELRVELSGLVGWQRVDSLGWLGRDEVSLLLARAHMGLVVLHPLSNYVVSLPIKLFEYMSAGIPVIASDFPLWRKIVEEAGCGLLVNPLDPAAIAEAMLWILDHPDEAAEMGRRGRQAVEERYNWSQEALKLVNAYRTLLPPSPQHDDAVVSNRATD